jgi:uncharacterized repeat protein (TIGR03803 family)
MKLAKAILLVGSVLTIALVAASAQADVTLTPLVSFTGTNGAALGRVPETALIQGSDGSFYGTTIEGGTNGIGGDGTVFKISTNGTFTTLVSFNDTNGANPQAGLVLASDGNFYGTTDGGTNAVGTIFQMTPSGVITSLFLFNGANGYNPNGLVQGADGFLYGTTYYGGTIGEGLYGTVFKISTNGAFTTLVSFDGTNGANSQAGLVLASDGNFYGTTVNGGTNGGWGTVFKVTTNGLLTSLISFNGTNGANPVSKLALGPEGALYGTTDGGGVNSNDSAYTGNGTVFKVTTNGQLTTLHFFAGYPDDGTYPQFDGLLRGTDGNFYGTTFYGGAQGEGTGFRISPSGTETTLYSFGSSPSDGVTPSAGLVQGSDGNFYGTTESGGAYTNGIVFELVVAGGGGGCTYTLNATNVSLTAKGGSKTVRVKANATNCAWTAVSNDPFVTITSVSNGTGSGTVRYVVPGNTNTVPLSGTMTIAGQTFTVNQVAGGCTYKLSPQTGRIKSAGGTFAVKVRPSLNDCDWTAVSNDGFITITNGNSGTGTGRVSCMVAPNATTNTLVGTMTIAGQTFTLRQAGAKAIGH